MELPFGALSPQRTSRLGALSWSARPLRPDGPGGATPTMWSADQSVLVHVQHVELAVAVGQVELDSRPGGGVTASHLGIEIARPVRRIEPYPARQSLVGGPGE